MTDEQYKRAVQIHERLDELQKVKKEIENTAKHRLWYAEKGSSTIINAYERYVLELPEREVPQRKKNQLIWLYGKPRYQDAEL